MVSKFLFSYNQLNLTFLIFQKKTVYQKKLLKKEAVENFEYRKNNNRY